MFTVELWTATGGKMFFSCIYYCIYNNCSAVQNYSTQCIQLNLAGNKNLHYVHHESQFTFHYTCLVFCSADIIQNNPKTKPYYTTNNTPS